MLQVPLGDRLLSVLLTVYTFKIHMNRPMSSTEIKSIIQKLPTNKVQDRFNIWNSVLSRRFREKKC